jgi:FMN phosphatase YigB (HAD superfamily)
MTSIRAVAFDVGNVLVDWLPEALVDPVTAATGLPGDRAMECVMTLYARSKKRVDLGDLSPRAIHEELNGLVVGAGGRAISYPEWLRVWCCTLRRRPGVDAVVRRVRRELGLSMWSNTDPVHFACWSQWLPCFSRARSIWLSYVVGVGKPDRAFFEGALEALGCAGPEVFFIDDTPANVEAARALGIEAVQAATTKEVEAALERRGLLER